MDTSRLDRCGWSTFDPGLFLNEPGRVSRDVSAFFIPLLKEFCRGSRVLELCCGAGKLVVQLAREGYEVTGVDLNATMLEVAQERVGREPEAVRRRIRLVQEDACTFNLGEAFDFIILEDDAFHYLLTQEDQLACLRRVHDHLAPNGHFLMAFETPNVELAGGKVHDYDPVTPILTLRNEWTVVDEKGGRSVVRQGIERRRQTYPCELGLLLACSGLEPICRWSDYDRTPFDARHGCIYLMRRAQEQRHQK